ncbi:MAG TPA: methyltransferase domain-containing protein [Anaerolineales bacterium]|nr:methyltransferase domain-containing protein [Anaerolineales bacterium]
MIENTLSTRKAQRFYDLIGKRYDWFEFYESRAKDRALELLDLSPGIKVLNVGVGTGKQQVQIQDSIEPDGIAFGLDISPVMLALAKSRCSSPFCRADAHQLPFAPASFDRLYAAYVLDLIPLGEIPAILQQFNRVLRPGGRVVLLALTEGVDFSSRAVVGAWKLAYAVSPVICGGCRPLALTDLVLEAGFSHISRQVVVQIAVPSEIIAAAKI